MTEYWLDLDPWHVVHWIREEQAQAGGTGFMVRATREYVANPAPEASEIEDPADYDLASRTTIGTLEVKPQGPEAPWRLVVRVEDEVGAHVPIDESAPDIPEEIDLDAFETAFLLPEHGTARIWIEAEDAAGRAAFNPVMERILTDRHGQPRGGG